MKRRTLLSAAAAASLVAACGRGDGPEGAGSGAASLRMAWWGNETRTKLTRQVIEAYRQVEPDLMVAGEPAEWAAYWDRLATQTAANDAPDVVQMDSKYLREYGQKGALLDLGQIVDTGSITEGTVDPGRTDNGLIGVNAGVNALLVAANPELFDRAGVELPDDETWTWQDWADLSAKITAAVPAVHGCSDFTLYDLGFWMWVRQRGKDLYTPDGLGFDATDAEEFFAYALRLEQTKAIPPVGLSTEDIVAPLNDRLFVKGQTAMSVYWSNQVQSLEQASGRELTLLRFPSFAGTVAEAKLFLNVSMMWSVPARSPHTEAAARFVDFLVNDPRAGAILKAERGLAANADVLGQITPELGSSDRKAARYLELIEPALARPPVAPPAGLGDIALPQTRHLQDVRFGRTDPATAAKDYVDELRTLLQ